MVYGATIHGIMRSNKEKCIVHIMIGDFLLCGKIGIFLFYCLTWITGYAMLKSVKEELWIPYLKNYQKPCHRI